MIRLITLPPFVIIGAAFGLGAAVGMAVGWVGAALMAAAKLGDETCARAPECPLRFT